MTHTMYQDQMDNERRHAEEGFTLAELMITLVIIGILVAAAFVGVPALFERVYLNNTKTTLKSIDTAIKTYKLDTGQPPSSLSDLYKNPGVEGWRGPYAGLKGWPEDGWGIKLVYHLTPDGKHPYELYSYGGSAGKQTPKNQRVSAWGR